MLYRHAMLCLNCLELQEVLSVTERDSRICGSDLTAINLYTYIESYTMLNLNTELPSHNYLSFVYRLFNVCKIFVFIHGSYKYKK